MPKWHIPEGGENGRFRWREGDRAFPGKVTMFLAIGGRFSESENLGGFRLNYMPIISPLSITRPYLQSLFPEGPPGFRSKQWRLCNDFDVRRLRNLATLFLRRNFQTPLPTRWYKVETPCMFLRGLRCYSLFLPWIGGCRLKFWPWWNPDAKITNPEKYDKERANRGAKLTRRSLKTPILPI